MTPAKATRKEPTMTERTTDERPEGLTDEHLEYLDRLRKSGKTNMFGSWQYLTLSFEIDDDAARAYQIYWMRTFGERHPKS